MATKSAKANVREELLTATGITPKKNETETALSGRVATYVDKKMGEDEYAALSEAAQGWYETYCSNAETKKDAPEMPTGSAPAKKAAKKEEPEEDAEGDGEEEGDAEGDGEEDEAPKKGKKAAAKKKAAAPAKKAGKKAKEEEGEGRVSVSKMIKEIICKNPKLTKEQVSEKITAAGYEIADTQLRNIYTNVQAIITILKELGWSKG